MDGEGRSWVSEWGMRAKAARRELRIIESQGVAERH